MEAHLAAILLQFCFISGLLSSPASAQSDACNSNFDLGPAVAFNTSSLHCSPVWSAQDFVLRYLQSGANQWDFVLSVPDPGSYVAVGFSADGKMVGSSAVVGWMGGDGAGVVKQYYLGGTRELQVQPDQGNLPLVNSTAAILSQASRLYLAFQLATTLPSSRLLYSVGPANFVPLSNNLLVEHRDKVSTTIDFNTGQSSVDDQHTTLRKSHGIVAMTGWGILMPVGATIARYFKQWDPLWFYSHSCVQGSAFVLGIVAIILGFSLEDKLSVDVSTHKALGICILAFGCLQVMALLIRPDKVSKLRKYWNWYHYAVGRILIAFAIGNVFYGISLGENGSVSWNVGYGVVLGIWLLVSACLEIRMWTKK